MQGAYRSTGATLTDTALGRLGRRNDRLGGGFPSPARIELGVALGHGRDRARDLAIGLTENAAGDDELRISHHTMMVIVGRLDH